MESSNSKKEYKKSTDGPELPKKIQTRLHSLFAQIESEFGALYAENVELKKTISDLSEKLSHLDSTNLIQERVEVNNSNGSDAQKNPLKKKRNTSPGSLRQSQMFRPSETIELVKGKSGSSQLSQKLRTTYKSGTSKLVSSFKPTAIVVCRATQVLRGHKDGVWDVATSPVNNNIVGSASADQKAKLWNPYTGFCIGTYHGHSGSVNCIRFHPEKLLALTVSGDSSAHLWAYESTRLSSCDEEAVERDDLADDLNVESKDYQLPILRSSYHTSPVIACDWLPDGVHFVTASWDRSSCLVDSSTNQVVQTLTGHDLPLTYVSAHSKYKMVVTSSRDSTFRVCDFRQSTTHCVIVGQGHSQTVSSAVFADDDQVVSSSDDRWVKVWDLKNMSSPLSSIRLDSSINRISVSRRGVIAIPHDNRQVRLYDTKGIRLARLPRNDRISHRRVVTATAWRDSGAPGLLTCGWDKQIINWNVDFPSSLLSLR